MFPFTRIPFWGYIVDPQPRGSDKLLIDDPFRRRTAHNMFCNSQGTSTHILPCSVEASHFDRGTLTDLGRVSNQTYGHVLPAIPLGFKTLLSVLAVGFPFHPLKVERLAG